MQKRHFGTNGGMGNDCSRFVPAFANKLIVKQDEENSVVEYSHGCECDCLLKFLIYDIMCKRFTNTISH